MASISVICHRGNCGNTSTKSCSRCRLVYYCSRECQSSDYPSHKSECKKLTKWEQQAREEACPLDRAQANDFVAALARQLDGQGGTPTAAPPSEDSPLHQLQTLARSSFENEKLLGKAGACEVLASALDRALADDTSLPREDICAGLVRLVDTCAKNRVALGKLGVIASSTEVLRRALREENWPLASNAANLLYKIGVQIEPSHCDQFGAADSFEVLASCLVAAAGLCESTISTAFQACEALQTMQITAEACTRAGCQNRQRLGRAPGVFAALDTCLMCALWRVSFAEKYEDQPEAVRNSVALSDVLRGVIKDVQRVCHGIVPFTPPGVYPSELVRSLASPRMCQNLSAAIALAGSPLYVRERLEIDADWSLVPDVMKIIFFLCEHHGHAGPFQQPVTCSNLVQLLKVGNEASASVVQINAVVGIYAIMAGDDATVTRLHQAGATNEVVEALRQAVERRDAELLCNAMDAMRPFAMTKSVVTQMAPGEDTCRVLVRTLQLALALEAAGAVTPGTWRPLTRWVDFWMAMIMSYPPCREGFLAAGAGNVLSRALGMPAVASCVAASHLYKTLWEWIVDPGDTRRALHGWY
eukprot:jgi/Mesvir1/24224/Mv10935-RA.1